MNPEGFAERLVGVKICIGGIPFIIRAAKEEETSGRIVIVAWEEREKTCPLPKKGLTDD